MAKRRKSKREANWYELHVTAAAVSIGRMGPKIYTLAPDGEAHTYITMEGYLDRPAYKDLLRTSVQVSAGNETTGNPGAAIGGTEVWHVSCSLPRGQFDDLLALVCTEKLAKVDLLFEGLRRGSGILRSVNFRTAPVPSEAEEG